MRGTFSFVARSSQFKATRDPAPGPETRRQKRGEDAPTQKNKKQIQTHQNMCLSVLLQCFFVFCFLLRLYSCSFLLFLFVGLLKHTDSDNKSTTHKNRTPFLHMSVSLLFFVD